jgi:hypothetical protein
MSYTFEQLKEDVRKEAEALKIHATKEERERLDYNKLHPESIRKCIYGLMTGDCTSVRSAALIETCACRYVKDACLTSISEDGFARIQKRINGSSVEGFSKERTGDIVLRHYSAIEAYILLPEANNESLISFLRGETETLEL